MKLDSNSELSYSKVCIQSYHYVASQGGNNAPAKGNRALVEEKSYFMSSLKGYNTFPSSVIAQSTQDKKNSYE